MTKYTIEWLLKSIENQEKHNYTFFWGHKPSKDGTIKSTCFSQWWSESPFIVDNITYLTAEHWMMAKKALLFEDKEIFEEIIVAKSPDIAKKLGRKVRNFEADIWDKNCFEIVKEGNIYKFSQHQRLKSFLLATKNDILVEASPYDKIWGIGMSVDNPACENPAAWNGLNLLGFALMEVRDKLNSEIL